MLTKASTSNIKQLWSLLKCTDNWGKRLNLLSECGNAEDINKHFASVATDPNYNKDNIITELTRYISSSVNTAESEASYSPDFIATVYLVCTKLVLDRMVFRIGYSKNVLVNCVSLFLC